MHGFSHMVISTKGKRNIADPATYLSQRHQLLYFLCCFYEVNCIVIVFFNTCCYRKNVGVKNDFLWVVAYLLGQNFISPVANFYFSFFGIGLPFFIKSHNDNGCTIAFTNESLFYKFCLAFFHADAVDNALALHTFQPGFYDFKLGAVYHDRYFGNVRLGLQQVEKSGHSLHTFQQRIVHVHVQYLCAVFYLLAGNGQCFFVLIFTNKPCKFFGTSHIGSFAYVHKIGLGSDD